QKYLSIPEGLSADSVAVIDPAMGTGTYGLSIVQHVAAQAEKYGPGAVADAVTSVAKRLYGIELQSGPFSVAELRLSQAIQEFGGQLPENGMHLTSPILSKIQSRQRAANEPIRCNLMDRKASALTASN